MPRITHKDAFGLKITFVWIPGGRFKMGSDSRFTDEGPVHWVNIAPFWLGETPITYAQYAVFLGATDHEKPLHWSSNGAPEANLPVTGVSWYDAVAFCKWLSRITGDVCFLPSEAQWEFAAKGTDGREYPWGDENPDNTRASFGKGLYAAPDIVGSFPAGKGPFGTLDQAGNVWEWCQDVWDEKAYVKRKEEELTDPLVTSSSSSSSTSLRALRGGSYWYAAERLRCACRSGCHAEYQAPHVGFRVAAGYNRCDARPLPASQEERIRFLEQQIKELQERMQGVENAVQEGLPKKSDVRSFTC